MTIQLETSRTILREFIINDLEDFHSLETDEDVVKYLTNYPKRNLEESKELLKQVIEQYGKFKTGRLAIIDKATKGFIGWCGIKFNSYKRHNYENFYDLGYRIHPKYWGNGYATEASMACIKFGQNELEIQKINAIVNVQNTQSLKVISKVGFDYKESFLEDNTEKHWFEVSKHKNV
jgi:RimJ/RimL family protein N-acetyltransferase